VPTPTPSYDPTTLFPTLQPSLAPTLHPSLVPTLPPTDQRDYAPQPTLMPSSYVPGTLSFAPSNQTASPTLPYDQTPVAGRTNLDHGFEIVRIKWLEIPGAVSYKVFSSVARGSLPQTASVSDTQASAGFTVYYSVYQSSKIPTITPTLEPTTAPSWVPTIPPSPAPTLAPTSIPSISPSEETTIANSSAEANVTSGPVERSLDLSRRQARDAAGDIVLTKDEIAQRVTLSWMAAFGGIPMDFATIWKMPVNADGPARATCLRYVDMVPTGNSSCVRYSSTASESSVNLAWLFGAAPADRQVELFVVACQNPTSERLDQCLLDVLLPRKRLESRSGSGAGAFDYREIEAATPLDLSMGCIVGTPQTQIVTSQLLCSNPDGFGDVACVTVLDQDPFDDSVEQTCVRPTQPQVDLVFEPCNHGDRQAILIQACKDDSCSTFETIEFDFTYTSTATATRPAQCFPKRSSTRAAAGVALAIIVFILLLALLILGVVARVILYTSESKWVFTHMASMTSMANFVRIMRTVQTFAILSEMRSVQENVAMVNYMTVVSQLSVSNLRLPWVSSSHAFDSCHSRPGDLHMQTRMNSGDMFAGNLFFSLITLGISIGGYLSATPFRACVKCDLCS
jgi:hypothetical protein